MFVVRHLFAFSLLAREGASHTSQRARRGRSAFGHLTRVAAWSAAGGETSAMGGGAPDPEGKASAKRKRIDALDRRLAGGKGASSAARASASRPGDSSRGRDGDRPSSVFRRDARGPRAGGRGARDGTPASRPRPEDDRSRLEPSSDRGAFAAQTDAPWYAPLAPRGAFAAARAGSIPVELTDSGTHAATAAGCRQARTAYVERTLVELAETSARTGADVDAVVRGKTRDRALLLDAAAAAGGGGARRRGSSAEKRTKSPSRVARHASRTWLRVRGARGALPPLAVADADASGADRTSYVARLDPLRRAFAAFLAGLAEPSKTKTSSPSNNTQSSGMNDDSFGRRLAEVKRRVLDLAEVRGGTVRIASCRDGKLVGRRGVVARVTARAAHVASRSRRSLRRRKRVRERAPTFSSRRGKGRRSGSSSIRFRECTTGKGGVVGGHQGREPGWGLA